MTEPNILELAKQGDANAIANLMNRKLQPKGITAKASMKNDCLQIMLSAAQVPPQETLVALIRKSIPSLGAESIKRVKVYGKQTGEEFPAWNEEFEVESPKLPTWEELAKDGDVNAIATLISQWLNSPSITAKVSLKNDCLQVKLESVEVPPQQTVVPPIRDGLISLDIQSIKKVKVFGQQTGDDFPDWQEEFELEKEEELPVLIPEVVVEVESLNSSIVTQQDNQLAPQKQSMWGSWFGAVAGAAGAVGSAAASAGGAIAGTVTGVAGTVGGAVVQAGGAVVEAAPGVAGAVGSAIGGTALQATEGLGYVVDIVTNSPLLQQVTKTLKVDWLLKIIDQVDIVKAETEVRRLQAQYPNEQPSEIAHRVMLEKALFAGGSGFASSLIPGAAVALFAVDLAANMLLQAEMVYQIASAYGFDLKDPARKGEVVAIFGLSIGGGQALKAGTGYAVKAGLTFLESVPIAGAVIGASANAAMLYALGYGACRFYETKNSPLTMEANLIDVQLESQKYLESALDQEVIMDQILVHIVLAGNAGKTWSEILTELQAANLSPASLEAISANIKSPPPLEALLEQINRDFAVPLLAQCQKIAQLDGVVTPEEAKVIETITKKFDIDIPAIQGA